jgi:hypothetical protein
MDGINWMKFERAAHYARQALAATAFRPKTLGNVYAPIPAIIDALEALAAERAAEREVRAGRAYYGLGGSLVPTTSAPETAYSRAVAAPRLGGQHPHDGRHVMSTSHWGMH